MPQQQHCKSVSINNSLVSLTSGAGDQRKDHNMRGQSKLHQNTSSKKLALIEIKNLKLKRNTNLILSKCASLIFK